MSDDLSESVPWEYWLEVCRGREAAQTFISSSEPQEVCNRFPILMLPEFVAALAGLAKMQQDPEAASVVSLKAEWLRRLQEVVQSKFPLDYAVLLTKLGGELLGERQGDRQWSLKRAAACFRQAYGIFTDGRDRAFCLLNEGQAHKGLAGLNSGDFEHYSTALHFFQEAERLFGKAPGRVLSLNEQARMRSSLATKRGLGADSRPELEEAVRLFLEARATGDFGPAVPDTRFEEAVCRSALASTGVDPETNLSEAIRLFQQAGQVVDGASRAAALGAEAHARTSLAHIGRDARANLEMSIHLHQQARRLLATNSEIAWSLTNEGEARTFLAALGQSARSNLLQATELFIRARAKWIESPGMPRGFVGEENAMGFASTILKEANAHFQLGSLESGTAAQEHLDAAIELYVAARTLFRQFGDDTDAAISLMNEGAARTILAERGHDAEPNLKQAVQSYQQAREFLRIGQEFAACMVNEATARQLLADLDIDADSNLDEAARLCDTAGDSLRRGGSYQSAARAYENYGRIAVRRRQWEMAYAGFQGAIESLEKVRRSISLMRDRQNLMEANSDLFIRMIETCLHLGRYDEAAEYAERGRSRALVDILHADNLQPRNVPADKVDAYRQLRRAAEAIEALLAQQYDSGTGLPAGPQSQRNSPAGILPDAHVSLLTERAAVYMRLWNLEDEIRQADPEFYMLAKPLRVADMAKLAGRLQRTLVMLWVGATKGAAFFVEPSGAFSHLPLPDVTDAMLRSWIFGISSDPSRGGWIGTYLRFREDPSKRREWTEQMSRTLANIHERLMKPIRDRLNTLQTARGTGAPHADDWGATPPPHRIALIAGGALGLLPFHAAADYRPDGKVNYLIDDFDIAYAPSAWILQRCVNRTRGRDLRMLAVGDPERSDSRPLPFAVWETDNISQMVQSVHAGTVDLLQGADGTTEQVHRLLPSHPIAHFSCHGEWNFQEPMQSALLLAGTGVLSLADLLTQIEMSQSKLVVLSACESGAGCRLGVGGEEYLGLPAGFMVAGARTVVGSLWSVLDPPTGLLMKRFYQHLLKGMEVTDALRRAQLWLKDMTRDEAFAEVGAIFPRKQTVTDGSTDLMEKYREWLNGLDEKPFAHPYYWAAFEVFGSPDGVYYEEFVSHAGSPGITEGKSGPL